ncbi:STAS domain-containing protein [Catenulispora subtropica]|uniref:Anti-sigma factor antagonist n=1 Tax=Catenulispora subtropica TaxID=450798 RepID=A0ABN2R7U1_9ACTN
MQLQWHYESRPDLGILALAGSLGAKGAPRLHGATGWALYHGAGPLIMDLAAVTEWTTLGQGEIIRTALRLSEAGRTLEIAAAPGPVPAFISTSGQPAITVHADLAAALAAHGAPAEPTGEFREWRSGGWPHPNTRF